MDDVTSNDEIITSNAEQVKGQLGYLCDFCYFGSSKWKNQIKMFRLQIVFFQLNFCHFSLIKKFKKEKNYP
jgi:hypothetical protein